MSMQIDAYIKSKAPSKHSIYFMWMGVNDIFELFKLHPNDNPKRRDILDGVIDSIHQDLVSISNSLKKKIIYLFTKMYINRLYYINSVQIISY